MKASYPASKAKEEQVFDFVGFSFLYERWKKILQIINSHFSVRMVKLLTTFQNSKKF